MMTKLKAALNNPKFWQAGFTVLLSYMGYGEISQHLAAPGVDVEVIVPDTSHEHAHSHTERPQKDWTPVIKAEVEQARKLHSELHHGGD